MAPLILDTLILGPHQITVVEVFKPLTPEQQLRIVAALQSERLQELWPQSVAKRMKHALNAGNLQTKDFRRAVEQEPSLAPLRDVLRVSACSRLASPAMLARSKNRC
jgi:hypothetical protein